MYVRLTEILYLTYLVAAVLVLDAVMSALAGLAHKGQKGADTGSSEECRLP